MNAEKKIADFMAKQQQPYEFKKNYAYVRAFEFIKECDKRGLNTYVSVGGLDSIVLYLFLKNIGIDIPAISVSHLEDKGVQKIHKELGIECIKPIKKKDGTYWNKTKIIQEFGFPALSKEIACKVEHLQNATEKNATTRHAIITGETGAKGGYKISKKMKLSKCWLKKFAGYENERENVNYDIAPFKLSSKCCYYLKEKPCRDWAKKNNSVPFLGLMSSEGGKRERSLMINGCNYFSKTSTRSAPFAIFNRQDLLTLALELNAPIPYEYGEIAKDKDGKLYTTKAQRTGCAMCGFGIHLEKRPHRFDRIRKDNFEEWKYWMYNCVEDKNTGEKYGWGKVLDYIGVGWKDEV